MSSHLLSSSPCSSPFQMCPLSPPDYACGRPSHPLHRYGNPPEAFPPPRGPSAYEGEGFCSLPLPASQLGYLPNHAPQGYAGLRLHTPPYSLYGYAFPPSPRLAASPEKMAAAAISPRAAAGLPGEPRPDGQPALHDDGAQAPFPPPPMPDLQMLQSLFPFPPPLGHNPMELFSNFLRSQAMSQGGTQSNIFF